MKRARIVPAVVATATLGALGVTWLLTTGVEVGAIPGPDNQLAAGLLGTNEVPTAADPDGTGSAHVSVDVGTDEVCWSITATGIEAATGAHIHNAAAGANGPIVVDFASAFSGCEGIGDALADDLVANPANYYVNIHTATYTGGAIRGQLALASAGPLAYFALPNPLRVYDSRSLTKLSGNETRNIVLVSGKNGAGVILPAVPVGAFAAQVVITVTQTSAAGFLSAHETGTPTPATSTINWTLPNTDIATGTVVPLDETGRLSITAGPGSGTHVIVDVLGYYYFPVI